MDFSPKTSRTFGFKTTPSEPEFFEWDEQLTRQMQTLFGEKSVETSLNFFETKND